MSHGKFSPISLDSTGTVTVTGPFGPDDPEVDSAKIIFLVVQGEGPNAVVVRGEGPWNRGAGQDWSGDAQRHGVLELGPSDLELETTDFDPPSIEALTWCGNILVTLARN